jgi:hypothetical protein
MKLYYGLILLINVIFIAGVQAVTAIATVDHVQKSVTVQRDGKEQPLVVGATLQRGDHIKSGQDGRVWIRFHDGSVVKLGEQAHFVLDQITPPSEKQGWLEATFHLVNGIFRFTSHTEQPQRAVEVRVGRGLSLGIRGTDFFAKATPDKDLVCLIRGQVEARAGEVKTLLTQPRQFFIVPQGKPPLSVDLISDEWFEKWVQETELSANK